MDTEIPQKQEEVLNEENRTIIVTNLNPSIEEKTISELFSFCGDIDFIKIIKSETMDTSIAIIQFSSSNSTKTSLLLSDATLEGRLIKVNYATKEVIESLQVDVKSEIPEEVKVEEQKQLPDEDHSASTVIAKILAKGYLLSDSATSEAKKLDEEWKVTSSIKNVLDDAKTNILSFDERYKISETAKTFTDKAVDSAKEISQKLHITDTANSISETANSWFNSISSSFSQTIDSMKESSSTFIENNFGGVVDKFRNVTGKASENIDKINTKANQIYESERKPEVVQEEKPNEEEVKVNQEEKIYPESDVVENA